MSESSQEHIAVAVRVRPLNASEVCILQSRLMDRKIVAIGYAGIVRQNITASIRWMRTAVRFQIPISTMVLTALVLVFNL